MKPLFTTLAIFAVSGCGSADKKSTTTTSADTPKAGKLTVKCQGHYADKWGADLLDADESVAVAATSAMKQIGKEGVPFVFVALKNDRAQTRIFGLWCLESPQTVKIPEVRAAIERMAKDDPDQTARARAQEMIDFFYKK